MFFCVYIASLSLLRFLLVFTLAFLAYSVSAESHDYDYNAESESESALEAEYSYEYRHHYDYESDVEHKHVFILRDHNGAEFECCVSQQSWIDNFIHLKEQGCIVSDEDKEDQIVVEVIHKKNTELLTVQEYLSWISAELHLVQMVVYGGLTVYSRWTNDKSYDIGVLGVKALLALPGLLQRHQYYLPLQYRKGSDEIRLFYNSDTGVFYSMAENIGDKQKGLFQGYRYWLMLVLDILQHFSCNQNKEKHILDSAAALSSLGLVVGSILSYFSWNGTDIGKKIADGEQEAEDGSI